MVLVPIYPHSILKLRRKPHLETKHWSGHICYDEAENMWWRINNHTHQQEALKDPVRQIHRNVLILERVARRSVLAGVVFTHPGATVEADPPDVSVVPLAELVERIQARPQALNAAEVKRIVTAVNANLETKKENRRTHRSVR